MADKRHDILAAPLIGIKTRRDAMKTLDGLIDTLSPDIAAAFHASMQDVVDNAVLGDMIAAIEAGNLEAAFVALGFSPAAMRPLTAAIERAYETSGEVTVATFPKGLAAPPQPPAAPPEPGAPVSAPGEPVAPRGVFRFDVRNVSAEDYLRDHSATLVQRLTDEAQLNVRNVLADGMAAGRNPRDVALDIIGRMGPDGTRSGGVIGLTNQQEGWIRGVRADLTELNENYFNRALRDKRFDATVRKAIDAGKPLPVDTVDKLVARSRDLTLQYRGETVARTEAMQALNQAEYEVVQQAVATGKVSASQVIREWDDAGDGKVRPSHAAMNGQRVGLNEPFITPDGEKLMFPGDTSLGADASEVINCRCRARTRINWFASQTE